VLETIARKTFHPERESGKGSEENIACASLLYAARASCAMVNDDDDCEWFENFISLSSLFTPGTISFPERNAWLEREKLQNIPDMTRFDFLETGWSELAKD
jgi:hypothetical protein